MRDAQQSGEREEREGKGREERERREEGVEKEEEAADARRNHNPSAPPSPHCVRRAVSTQRLPAAASQNSGGSESEELKASCTRSLRPHTLENAGGSEVEVRPSDSRGRQHVSVSDESEPRSAPPQPHTHASSQFAHASPQSGQVLNLLALLVQKCTY
jgi:hypothetical protein